MSCTTTVWQQAVHRYIWTIALLVLVIPGLLVQAPMPAASARQQPAGQMRAFWVDSQHLGYRNPQEVDELVENVVRANANTIIAQMRWRGDARYNHSIEPRAADPLLPPASEFDPLGYLLSRAHARGITVHAWLNTSVTCKKGDPLEGHPDHVCTTHGPAVADPDRWTTATHDGIQVGDLDFGHPSAVHHLEAVVQHLLRHYPDLDGIHFDYIRYGDVAYGYNQVSLDRFNRATGNPPDYRPAPRDAAWSQWRRDQTTALMRRLYLRSKAINPDIQVSIAAITWGGAGSYTPDDWPNSAAYARVFQDWRAWLEEGLVDFAIPMHYFEESDPQERGWYDGWLAWDREHTGRRAIVAGTGAFINTPEESIAQLQQALASGDRGKDLSGVTLFSYYKPFKGEEPTAAQRRQFMQQLGRTVFAEPAHAPDWPWIVQPTTGHVQGMTLPDTRVSLLKDGTWLRDITAAPDGWYGAVDLQPGTYTVVTHDPNGGSTPREVVIRAGQVTTDTTQPAYPVDAAVEDYWEQNGGLAVFGYPIGPQQTEAVEGQPLQVQWFERNRLELHPENAPPYHILLGRLSEERLLQLGRVWQNEPRATGPQSGCLWFAQTQHNVCDQAPGLGFKSYWEGHGLKDPRLDAYGQSLALFGLPLTEPRMETNASGDTVLTQWFERARFEWHPNNPDEFKVLLGLLGSEVRTGAPAP